MDCEPRWPMVALSSDLSEASLVVSAAFRFIGWQYQITRELREGMIDCSTLVSQAYWEGGGIRIPFRAEAQLNDPRATAVDPENLQPSDLIFAYRSAAESRSGRHNHVAMYIGEDAGGERWVIESREPEGVRFEKLNTVRHDGGYRRFCRNSDEVFQGDGWQLLARQTQKLGRLSARLTFATAHHHRRHLGTDVVLEESQVLASPVDGRVVRIVGGRQGGAMAVAIESERPWRSTHVLGPWTELYHGLGKAVARGQSLGLSSRRHLPGCNVTPRNRAGSYLHWEVWSDIPIVSAIEPGLRYRDSMTAVGAANVESQAHNAVYLTKLGLIGSPLNCQDQD